MLQLRDKFQTVMVLCSIFIWITNSSDDRGVWTAPSQFETWLKVKVSQHRSGNLVVNPPDLLGLMAKWVK